MNQDNCDAYSNPVCDNSESSHTSLCSFLRTHSNLDYLGYCKVGIHLYIDAEIVVQLEIHIMVKLLGGAYRITLLK